MPRSKLCFKCETVKTLSQFYKHPQMPDGHVNKCKECNKKDVRENRKAKIEYYREYDRSRSMLPKRVDARIAYAKTEDGIISCRISKKKWERNNQDKKAANIILNNAVRDKRITKGCCEVCGSTLRIHGHHDDYSKPLFVRWLCPKHHADWHKMLRGH